MKLAPPQKRQKYDGYWKKFHYNSQPISLFSFATTLKGSSSSSLQKGKDGSLITRKPICIFNWYLMVQESLEVKNKN